ncbi:TPA: hypothetical protein ACPSKY_003671 [Legionella bozemanae]|uniref:hypothetical protein n=1 Tax=Legionella bozemanae TaxID=447 RepID=UPI0010412664|nr:hypothetical protein [Legionella bozemanae]
MKATERATPNDLKPYEMGLIQRIINIISMGYFFAEEIKCESSCINMKNALMKSESELQISETADLETGVVHTL